MKNLAVVVIDDICVILPDIGPCVSIISEIARLH